MASSNRNNRASKASSMEETNGKRKGLWKVEEDRILMDYIRVHGKGNWNRIAKVTGLKRCGKSCRLRWMNYLSPSVKRGDFSQEEDDLIIRLHKLLGNRWSLIAGRVPGRTDNQVKNHWNTHLRKKLGLNNKSKSKNGRGSSSSSSSPSQPASLSIINEAKDVIPHSIQFITPPDPKPSSNHKNGIQEVVIREEDAVTRSMTTLLSDTTTCFSPNWFSMADFDLFPPNLMQFLDFLSDNL